MWDAELIARVKDRKLEEIIDFAFLAKYDTSNIDRYIDVIVSLGDDIDACDTLLDTDGEAIIEMETIDCDLYFERLDDDQLEDELAFNSLKQEPVPVPSPDTIEEYVRGLLAEAVESLSAKASEDNEGVAVLKQELSECRARIETLYQELEFARAEAKGMQDTIEDQGTQILAMNKQLALSRSEVSMNKTEANIALDKLAVLEPAYEEALRTIEELKAAASTPTIDEPEPDETPVEIPAEEPIDEPVVEVPVVEESVPEKPIEDEANGSDDTGDEGNASNFLSEEKIASIRRVRDYKNAKIDQLIDQTDVDGRQADINEGIIDFLKVDMHVCDTLLTIDFSDKSSVIAGFNKIIHILTNSGEPQFQDEYTESLTQEEGWIEVEYTQILNSLQSMIMYLRPELDLE